MDAVPEIQVLCCHWPPSCTAGDAEKTHLIQKLLSLKTFAAVSCLQVACQAYALCYRNKGSNFNTQCGLTLLTYIHLCL